MLKWRVGKASMKDVGTNETVSTTLATGLSRLCVQRVIWTPITLFFDSLDTQKFMSEFADDDFSWMIQDDEEAVVLHL